MNAMIQRALVLIACVLLAACASAGKTATSPPQEQRAVTAEQQYIAYVERVARRRGIQVTWVNPPHLREKVDSKH
ncbi:outer membrane biogenesis lipoprotein LolB [Pseudoxanthomonas japonensis]|uniref:hypothetical protein n=1 Tax=Pseudoxanthomonas japonensis TaxID=69284 RepID=UPI00285E3224|nr:hypothetical protein [Pseudoxanthomonas japonensis]MDR7069184.1 outer membrane biogenesis lipoprotein LolB [Pseudoxanthomonas japonensis]